MFLETTVTSFPPFTAIASSVPRAPVAVALIFVVAAAVEVFAPFELVYKSVTPSIEVVSTVISLLFITPPIN